MMEAAPATPFEMSEPDLLLEFLIVALDAPAQLGAVDQTMEGNVLRKRREPGLGRLLLALGPLDQQPFFRAALAAFELAPPGPHPHTGEAPRQLLCGSLAPRAGSP